MTVKEWIVREWWLWRNVKIAKAPLGKYIVLNASILHIGWAVLLCISPLAGRSTPLHLIVVLCGGAYRAAFVLVLVAVMALSFVRMKAVQPVRSPHLSALLFPQQLILLMSAFAGILATWHMHYADGVVRGWEFILADQLPVILLALLYSMAAVEAALDP